MYLHCKHGFVEADAWDGMPIHGQNAHTEVLTSLQLPITPDRVIILRSRRRDTLHSLLRDLPRYKHGIKIDGIAVPVIAVLESPPGWDYEFRAYVTAAEWGKVLARVASGLDYRNFKHYAAMRAPQEATLAADIWHAAARDKR